LRTDDKRKLPDHGADILGSAKAASVQELAENIARSERKHARRYFLDEIEACCPRKQVFSSQHDIQLVEQARSLISGWTATQRF